jgi:hypothetical protein
MSGAKPEGAARLELFVDLIPPGEPIPNHPGHRHGGLGFYLRSFTRSPLKVEYPKTDSPMRVVYWGRWASSTGEPGPFSRALVAPIDMMYWSQFALPGPTQNALQGPHIEQKVLITSARRELPDCVETIDTLQASRLVSEKTSQAA